MLIPPTLPPANHEPTYKQIYRYYKEEILFGRIPAHTKLPSIRQLAEHLAISRNPVEMAYAMLVAEGFLVNRPKSGYFTVQLEQEIPLRMLPISDEECKTAEPAPIRSETSAVYSFDYDKMDVDSFPYRLWRKLTLAVMQPTNRELMHYGDKKGELSLRKLIAAYLYDNRGVNCHAEQIVITSGSQQTAAILSRLLCGEQQVLAVEAMMHPGMLQAFKQSMEIVAVPVEKDGIAVDDMIRNQSIGAVYTTPSHQFPSGAVMSAAKRVKLLEWAADTGSYIIEDDYNCEFVYEGAPVPALQGIDRRGRVVYIGTFSKSLAPAIRISFMILPDRLIGKFDQLFRSYDQTASRLTQKTMELFMLNGHYDRHVRRMRKLYRHKRDNLIAAVKSEMDKFGIVSGSAAGLHVILEWRSDTSADILVALAGTAGVRLEALANYAVELGSGSETGNFPRFLLGYGGLSDEQTKAGIARLAAVWINEQEIR